MKTWILKRLVELVAGSFGFSVHPQFDLTQSADLLYQEGVIMKATGFVFADGEDATGLYIVKYVSSNQENKYGRYN